MWKIMCKNVLALYRYRDFHVGIFYFASPSPRRLLLLCEGNEDGGQ